MRENSFPQLDFSWRDRLLLSGFLIRFLHVGMSLTKTPDKESIAVWKERSLRTAMHPIFKLIPSRVRLELKLTLYWMWFMLISFGMFAHIMTFSFLRDRPTARPPVPSFLWDPPRSTLGFSPLCSVTRQGVRGLIICTDPGLSPQGGCLGTVALDPIDTVRGRRRGEENRPWLQSVGPPRQVDECPGLHDLCHPSQWSQATMSYSL